MVEASDAATGISSKTERVSSADENDKFSSGARTDKNNNRFSSDA